MRVDLLVLADSVRYSSTDTLVIDLLATVIWTCTGPYRMSAAVPVTVFFVAAVLAFAALAELDAVEPAAAAAALVLPAVPLALVLVPPLYGVAADVLPPAAVAVDEVDVW